MATAGGSASRDTVGRSTLGWAAPFVPERPFWCAVFRQEPKIMSVTWKKGLVAGLFIIAAAYLGTAFLAWSMVQAFVHTMVRLLRLL